MSKLDKMVGRRVQVVSSAGGFVDRYIGKVGTISRIKANNRVLFRVVVVFSTASNVPYGLVPLNEIELRYLNNKKVTLD